MIDEIDDEIVVALSCDGSSGDQSLESTMAGIFKELFILWKDRQKKYGPGNIAAFMDTGCLVRGHDKMARLRHVYIDGKGAEVDDESVEDSWKDLANYAAMGLACKRDLWPKV